ncbi:amidohydrolase family protein, partial [Leucobacter sp. M11]|uniref:amidohydrolase family protein n=1 Tax=Leucobacter sp. M11 TaxID=2993565 RepID=UPI002D7F3138
MTLIDAHVHVWDTGRLRYPWLADVPVLTRSHLPEHIDRSAHELPGATEAPGDAGMVFVEAGCVPEQFLAEARAASDAVWPELRGIVAGADLTSPDLVAHLTEVRAIPLVVGVRHNLQGLPTGALNDPAFRAGLAAVAAAELSFDACVTRDQLPELAAFLEAGFRDSPGLRVVLDHLGKPAVDEGLDSAEGHDWAEQIRRIAALPGVAVKLSGLAPEASSPELLTKRAPEFLRFALETFGPERCLYGSDWPVSAKLGAGGTALAWRALVRDAVTAVSGENMAARTAVDAG